MTFYAHSQVSCAFGLDPNLSPSCSNPGSFTDYGNERYIPDEHSPILTVNLNFWVMQKPGNPFANFREIPEHINYLNDIVSRMTDSIYSVAGRQELCDGQITTAPPSVDTKIRFNLKNIFFKDKDLTAYNNAGSSCDDYSFDKYAKHDAVLSKDLNVFFSNVLGDGSGGCGPAYSSEESAYIIVNNAYNRYWALGTEARNLAHELGHAFTLFHFWDYNDDLGLGCLGSTGANDGPASNQMMAYNSNQNYIHPLEAGHMRRGLLTTWRSKWIDVTPEKEILTINQHEVWDTEVNWEGDIVIEAGGQLEINNTLLQMGEGSKILVKRGAKIIVNNSIINACTDRWEGIVVEGARQSKEDLVVDLLGQLDDPFATPDPLHAGTVIVHNGSVIKNAVNAISCAVRHISGSAARLNYYGGLIYTDSARFENCRRSVEIMKTSPFKNNSVFKNTVFTDGIKGVSIWSSNGVTFEQDSFLNMEDYCIHTYNTQLQIFGNVFDNARYGIYMIGTQFNNQQNIIGEIGEDSNVFTHLDHAVSLNGVWNSHQTIIADNDIRDCAIGFQNIGRSSFEFRNNSIISTTALRGFYGAIIEDAGLVRSYAQFNEHRNRSFGYVCYQDNGGLSILDNCFTAPSSAYDYDVYLESSKLFTDQGNEVFAAGNNFSTPDIETDPVTMVMDTFWRDIQTIDSDSFNYYILNNNPGQFDVPNNEGTYKNVFQSDAALADGCGFQSPAPPPAAPDCSVPVTENEALILIQDLETAIQAWQLQGPSKARSSQLASLRRCLEGSLTQLARIKYDAEDYAGLIQYFGARSEFHMRTLAYGVHLELDDYLAARSYLSLIAPSTDEENDYVFAQTIYLNQLEDPNSFVLSANNKSALYASGLEKGPLRGTIRAIYYLLTDERVPYDLPESRERRIEKKKDRLDNGTAIYPNPNQAGTLYFSNDQLMIEKVSIYNLQGRICIDKPMQSHKGSIDINKLSAGIYLAKVQLINQRTIQQKIIVVN